MTTDDYSCHTAAKINLFLDVISRRNDGYHNIVTVMQPVGLHDYLLFKKIDKPGYFKIATEKYHLPVDEHNLVHKAYIALKEVYPYIDGIFVGLTKNIPVSAGMGGGSSDCAASLKALRHIFSLPVMNDELRDIAVKLGADVPFFIDCVTALAEGIGERLTPISGMPDADILIIHPPIRISTAAVFKKLDVNNLSGHKDVEPMLCAIKNGSLSGISSCLHNSLEEIVIPDYPVVGEIKKALMDNGALGALMSGSGPTVFGIFPEKHMAVETAEIIRTRFPYIRNIFVTMMECQNA